MQLTQQKPLMMFQKGLLPYLYQKKKLYIYILTHIEMTKMLFITISWKDK